MEATQQGNSGVRFFASFAVVLAVAMAALMAVAPDQVEGVRLVIRATARISMALFLAAFLAGALVRVWPGTVTHWLRANRRWLGLAFAWSHLVHMVAILALVRLDPVLFWTLTNPVSVAGGTVAYLFIAALAATSFDRAVRTLGPARWALLHRVGVCVIWLVFLISNAKRIPISPWYAVPCAILLSALAVRLAGPRLGRAAREPA